MSRIDDNQKIINKVSNYKLSSIDITAIVVMLEDISQSLAIIADCCLDEWQKSNMQAISESYCIPPERIDQLLTMEKDYIMNEKAIRLEEVDDGK